MPYTMEYLEKEGIALITNTGDFTHEDFMKQAQEALELSLTKDCKRLLVDCTSMIVKSKTVEIFDTAKFYDEIDAPRKNAIALVVSKGTDTEADLKFYETVCTNRGWLVRMFDDRGSAMKWLKGLT